MNKYIILWNGTIYVYFEVIEFDLQQMTTASVHQLKKSPELRKPLM